MSRLAAEQKVALYQDLLAALEGLLEKERDWLANLANTSALLFERLPSVNWAGFYRLVGDVLVLGPFQGRIACTRIGPGRGVCGAAIAQARTMVVPDVHEFPGHIACDAASRSEIVVPVRWNGALWGVLDVDSPELATFDHVDARHLEVVVRLVTERSSL